MLLMDLQPASAAALSRIRSRALEHSFLCRCSASTRAEACLVNLSDVQCLLQVGMRHFNIRKNQYFCPIINLDKLWSLVGEEVCSEYTQQLEEPAACHGAPCQQLCACSRLLLPTVHAGSLLEDPAAAQAYLQPAQEEVVAHYLHST